MKKALAILLAFSCVLALGVIAFAEDISDALSSEPEESMVESIAETEDVTDNTVAEEPSATESEQTVETEPEQPDATEPEYDAKLQAMMDEISVMNEILSHRIPGGYWYDWEADENGKVYTYELPEEIVEKYGTRVPDFLPPIIVYESTGELDSTETLRIDYYGEDENRLPVLEKTETVTIEIPAGGIAFYVADVDPADIGRVGISIEIIGATYGDLSTDFSAAKDLEYDEEQLALLNEVFTHRIPSAYKYDRETGKYNYELPEEIVEKYGTRDPDLLPPIMVYESTCELDCTETLRINYDRWVNGERQVLVKSEIVTIEIPAGGVAFYVLDIDPADLPDCGAKSQILGATYGDLRMDFCPVTKQEQTPVEEPEQKAAPEAEVMGSPAAEESPAEDVPAEDVPAEDAPANEPVHISGADGYSAEELEMLDAVLGKRTGTGYSSWSFDEFGNLCEGSDYCNYELSAEIAEKYGTRDSLLLPPIMIYESIGEFDATETLRYDFYRWGENGEEIFVKSETFTIEIPAGEVVFYPLDINPDDLRDQGFDTARGVIVSATYGDLSIVFDS